MTLLGISYFLSIGWLLFLLCVLYSQARDATKTLAFVWVFGLGGTVGWAVLMNAVPAVIDQALGLRAETLFFSTLFGHGSLDIGPFYSGLFTTVGTLAVAVVYLPLRAMPRLVRRAIKARAARTGRAV